MGVNFSALIHYSGPTRVVLDSITYLENGGTYPELQSVIDHGRRMGFAFADHAETVAAWHDWDDWEHVLSGRPLLSTLKGVLDLPSDFSLAFGLNTIWVHHTLRWSYFVTEREWQRIMLGAIQRFCEELTAIDCIIAPDSHPAVLAFQRGAPFYESLRVAEDSGEGEVSTVDALFIDNGHDDELSYLDSNGDHVAIPLWDTRGFWRFDFRRDGVA